MPQQTERTAPETTTEEKGERPRRLDLSVAQVAASALAAVVGAVLASELGVYGTILGAAVVSVGATTGGAVFQHVFRRTGEQLRSAVERGSTPDRPVPAAATGLSSEWNAPQLVRAKRRWTWRSYAIVSALVFVLAMAPIVVVELAAGKPMHDITTGRSGSGTSFNPTGKQSTPTPRTPPTSGSTDPAKVPSDAPSSTRPSPSPSSSASTSPSPSPSSSPSGSPSPTPSDSASAQAGAVTPSGSPSSEG